jgi:hypothetical protein
MEKFLIDDDQLTRLRRLQEQLADSSPMPFDMRRALADELHTLIMSVREQIIPDSIEDITEGDQEP